MKKIIVVLFALFLKAAFMAQPSQAYYGILNAHKISVNSFNGQVYTNNTIDAVFNDVPQAYISPSNGIKVDEVKFNSLIIPFKKNKAPYPRDKGYYSLNKPDMLNFIEQQWEISGNNTLPGFTFNNPASFPFFTGIENMQDTIRKTDTLFIPFNALQNADSIAINITDSTGGSVNQVRIITTYKTGGFVLMPETITSFNISGNVLISLWAVNYTVVNVTDKKFLFRNYYECFKGRVTIID